MLKELEKNVLSKAREKKSAEQLASSSGIPLSSVMSALESLKEKGFAHVEAKTTLSISLTHEGGNASIKGLPERRLASALRGRKSLSVGEARDSLLSKSTVEGGLSEQEFGIALQWAKAFALVKIDKGQIELASEKRTPHE